MAILFDEILFDPNMFSTDAGNPFDVEGWPELANTTIVNPATGIHKTNVNRVDAIEVIQFNAALLTAADREYFMKIWRGGYGSGVGLRVRIPYDYTATLEAFAVGDGSDTTFQLYKTYTRPGVTARQDVRKIVKPVVQVGKETNGFQLYQADGVTARTPTNSFKIYFGASEQTSGWTANAKTGVVTFSSPPPNTTIIKWSGEFDVPMAFRGNSLPFRHGPNSEAQGIQMREILPAELGL